MAGYRDHCDGANRLSILPFGLDNVEEFKSFVGRQNAVGGDDFAEGACVSAYTRVVAD